MLNLQEKADKIIEEEEELFKTHMAYLKEDAQLLTEEGKLINNLQRNFGNENVNDIKQRCRNGRKRYRRLHRKDGNSR